MQPGIIILTMKFVVVITRNVVVDDKESTTTCFPIVTTITIGKCMWSLILLTTEPSMTMNDHIFVVVKNF
jgi:hypothetical protein